jgi:hypothetical protein
VSAAPPLALFPLNAVLFPGGPLALRIFEPRYLDMVRRCLKQQLTFGVVRLLDGTEAGAAVTYADTGTTARLVDFDTQPDGLLGVVAIGEQRFRVLERQVQADGLHLAQVSYLPAPAPCLLPADFAHLADLLREVLPKFGGAYAYVAAHYEDAGWVADRLAEIVPLALEERQSLLELDDPLARLTQVAAWSARQPTTAQI